MWIMTLVSGWVITSSQWRSPACLLALENTGKSQSSRLPAAPHCRWLKQKSRDPPPHPALLVGDPWLQSYICRVSCGRDTFFREADVSQATIQTPSGKSWVCILGATADAQQPLTECVLRVFRVLLSLLWTGAQGRNWPLGAFFVPTLDALWDA